MVALRFTGLLNLATVSAANFTLFGPNENPVSAKVVGAENGRLAFILPIAPLSSATYDAANELTHWNGIGLTYDNNGNMLSDGSNAFTWNARNQVASLNNVSVQYDAFGRRVKNVAGTSFLYDGANAVQELSGTTVMANLLSGGTDEVFSRTDSSGAFAQLKDATREHRCAGRF